MTDCYEPGTPECVIGYRDGEFVVTHHHRTIERAHEDGCYWMTCACVEEADRG